MSGMAVVGILLVVLAGLGVGTSIWPMKVMRQLQFEHYWFVAMLVGLFIIPWGIVLARVPDPWAAYSSVGWETLLKANLFAFGWGIANVLCGLCIVRIGAALTGAIMTGLGIMAGTILPMILKGSGLFANAPDIMSPSGKVIMVGLGIMICGVILSSFAGFGRAKVLDAQNKNMDSEAKNEKTQSRGFTIGLIMALIAGITSAGLSLSFVYAQGPIKEAMALQGVDTMTADVSVWAAAILSGAAVNIIFPLWIMIKRRNWNVLLKNPREAALATIIGIQFIVGVTLMGRGMLLLGVLGASVGFAIQQIVQVFGNQLVGFLSGEWKNIFGRPRKLMYLSLAVLACAIFIIASSNMLAK